VKEQNKSERGIRNDELARVLEELTVMEKKLHRPPREASRSDLEQLLAEDFHEIGASGQRYTREFALEELECRLNSPEDPNSRWEITNLHCQQFASDVYLLTYMLLQSNTRLTERSTVWKRTGEGWHALFHQGTLVQQQKRD
jgi:hypothetical protein